MDKKFIDFIEYQKSEGLFTKKWFTSLSAEGAVIGFVKENNDVKIREVIGLENADVDMFEECYVISKCEDDSVYTNYEAFLDSDIALRLVTFMYKESQKLPSFIYKGDLLALIPGEVYIYNREEKDRAVPDLSDMRLDRVNRFGWQEWRFGYKPSDGGYYGILFQSDYNTFNGYVKEYLWEDGLTSRFIVESTDFVSYWESIFWPTRADTTSADLRQNAGEKCMLIHTGSTFYVVTKDYVIEVMNITVNVNLALHKLYNLDDTPLRSLLREGDELKELEYCV